MAFNAAEQHTEQPKPQDITKSPLNAAEYWKPHTDDKKFSARSADSLPDSLTMTSPYAKSEVRDVLLPESKIRYEPLDPKDSGALDQPYRPKDGGDVKEQLDPRKEADKRDADAMMDAIRNGKMEDLKNMVSDMSPDKLKRVAEQMKAEGYDMTTTKDGKFVMFNKDLGIGVSIQPGKDGEPAKAEVVKKDKDGNFVPSTDGQDPEKVLKTLGSQIPLSDTDIAKLVEELEKKGKRNLFDPELHPHHLSWDLDDRVRPDENKPFLL